MVFIYVWDSNHGTHLIQLTEQWIQVDMSPPPSVVIIVSINQGRLRQQIIRGVKILPQNWGVSIRPSILIAWLSDNVVSTQKTTTIPLDTNVLFQGLFIEHYLIFVDILKQYAARPTDNCMPSPKYQNISYLHYYNDLDDLFCTFPRFPQHHKEYRKPPTNKTQQFFTICLLLKIIIIACETVAEWFNQKVKKTETWAKFSSILGMKF